jgi:hypothetical protein
MVTVPGYRFRGPGFDSRCYQIFWVVGLERGPLSLVSTTEELLGRNSSGFGLENREYGRGDPLRWPRDTLYPHKLALTSPTYGGRSVGIVRLRTKTTEVFFILIQAVEALRVARGWGSHIFRHSAHRWGKVVSPTRRPLFTPRKIPGTKFC